MTTPGSGSAPQMRTRSDVRTLIKNEQTDWPQALVSYQTAVQAMRALDPPDTQPPTPPTNTQSWQYLAAVHGRPLNANDDEDHSDPLWTQCQHGSWFFFPWHRMYLLTLEAYVQHFSGDSEWSVPYWYAIDPDETNPDVLPTAFLQPTDGNALYIEERSTRANQGLPIAGDVIIATTTTTYLKNLQIPNFSTNQLRGHSFGGGEYAQPKFLNSTNGAIESIPHGPVHNLVGSDYDPNTGNPVEPIGFMTDLLTAARDPIFWLHHSNIDRLWQMWLDLNPAHQNSADPAWLNSAFTFPTPDGQTQSWKVSDVLATTDLGYEYDTVSPPSSLAPAVTGLRPREVVPTVSPPTPPPPPQAPQLIGASVNVAMVAGHSVDISLSRPATQPRAVAPDEASGRPQRWELRLEGITGTIAAPLYSVYLNLPAAASPADHPERLAGTFSTFGVELASKPGGEHDGRGQTHVLDITEAHDALVAAGDWDSTNVNVAFVPLVPPAPDDAALAARIAAAPRSASDLRAARVAILVAPG